ncbi:MAG: tagaturonate epimerase family protein, partial [bacterium]
VADAIGHTVPAEMVNALVKHLSPYVGNLQLPGLDEPLPLDTATLQSSAHQYLAAVQEAARLYHHIAKGRGARPFLVEVSMDEVNQPQSPADLLVILAALAAEKVPVRTIAPRFTGAFHKGVDYIGDPAQFEREFDADAAVVAFAVRKFGLPPDLKLSVHSGSDKFAIYPAIRRVTRRRECGVHLKTAGTTWLEEAAGLAESGDEGLAIVKEIYAQSLARFDEFCAPYAAVIAIERTHLPAMETVANWEGWRFAKALRHNHTNCLEFNPHLRQLLHVGYKAAAEMGPRYRNAVTAAEAFVGPAVTRNLLERHIRPLFLGE